MPLLACKDYVPPILTVLQQHPEGLLGGVLSERVADATALTETERKDAISDGTPKYIVRIKQARYWLKKRGFVAALTDGSWAITKAGEKFLLDTGGIPAKLVKPFAKSNTPKPKTAKQLSPPETLAQQQEELEEAPLEKIDRALNQILDALESELLQRLSQVSPVFFEKMVLDLLRAMGYAGNLGDVEHTGGSGDGGIDGILYMDRLKLERVYVQAKRWTKPVGAPELQHFCGALSVNHAQKGVIMSTSMFTNGAEECARKAPQAIRLITGKELARLMIEFGIGVSRTKAMVIPALDRDFFEDI